MDLTFSQRMGHKLIKDTLQIESMDTALRNTLWNYCDEAFFHYYKESSNSRSRLRKKDKLKEIWTQFFKQKSSEGFQFYENLYNTYNKFFSEASWYEVYDLLEFLVKQSSTYNYGNKESEREKHIGKLNEILEKEMSGYRFIGPQLTPIISEQELESINDANLEPSASIHIQAAVGLLSNRDKHDYRNSIKESISAVEAVCREITGESTLGNALKSIEKTNKFNSQLMNGLEKIYAYTNNKDTGIRHALLDDSTEIKFEDAKFMLVICSAFINYIRDKSK